MPSLILKPRRDDALRRRHPWIFSGAIKGVDGDPKPGDTIDVLAAGGEWLARAAWSPKSQISARVWTFDRSEEIGPPFFRARIERAIARRALPDSTHGPWGRRLVHAESDLLPGLILDRYGSVLVCQFLSAGVEFWRDAIVGAIAALYPGDSIYDRSDVDVRNLEGLPGRHGHLAGPEPPALVEIQEGPCRYLVDVRNGHKTGFYLDQRESRARLADYSPGAGILNVFSYSGAFGVAALRAGAARVVNLDSSADALALGRRNLQWNGIADNRAEDIEGDAFRVLRTWRDEGRQFDLVILDPPKFVDSRAHLERAARGYKDINLLAFKLLRPGGVLFTFSCSGLMPPDLFQKIVADAALDAGREAAILERLSQPDDHPVALPFPEGAYLKGLIIRA